MYEWLIFVVVLLVVSFVVIVIGVQVVDLCLYEVLWVCVDLVVVLMLLEDGVGFENWLVVLIGEKLGVLVSYIWFL